VVPPGMRFRRERSGNLIIEIGASSKSQGR
jgi:hypothetical protein